MDKAIRQKFGLVGGKIKVTKVYRKEMDFDHADTKNHPGTGAWIFITTDGKLGQANTYSGNLGRNYSLQTSDMPDEKSLKKRLKEYKEVTDLATEPGGDVFELVGNTPAPTPETPAATPPVPTEEEKADEAAEEIVDGTTPA